MQPKITFKRIINPKGKDFEQLWKIYQKCFPIRDERATRIQLKETASAYSLEEKGKYVDCYLLSIIANGKIAGGAIFDYVEGRIIGKRRCFAINWYLFIDRRYRHIGLATAFHEFRLKMLTEKAKERGLPGLDVLVCEFNDPEKMDKMDKRKDSMVINEHERLEFFQKLGYRRMDFDYIQPQLTGKTKPYKGLMFGVLPIRKELSEKIPAQYLKQLLWLYTWVGFDGIPGSNVNGHRDPDTDKAYLRMERQLEALGRQKKFLSLKSLVRERK